MISLFVSWFVLVELEVIRNAYIILKLKVSPKHKRSGIARACVIILFWILSPFFFNIEPDQFWLEPLMLFFTSWWLFNVSLNLFRGKSLTYLDKPEDPEEDSSMDALELKIFKEELPAFFFKTLFAGASTTAFIYGYHAILSYN